MPDAKSIEYWTLDLTLFCPGFLCQVLNQTWDLLGFFMFTSKTSSKTTTAFQEWNKLDGHLSSGLGHYLYLLASSLGMINDHPKTPSCSAKLLSNLATSCWIPEMHCMLAWRLLDATSSWKQFDSQHGRKWCTVTWLYGIYPKPWVLPHFLYLFLQNYGICSIFTLSTGWHRRQKLVVYAACLATSPHTWRIWCLSTWWSWKIARLINVHHSISISIFTHLSLSFLTLSCLYRFPNLA